MFDGQNVYIGCLLGSQISTLAELGHTSGEKNRNEWNWYRLKRKESWGEAAKKTAHTFAVTPNAVQKRFEYRYLETLY